ncbi:MAG: VOC family protein [Alphaproteobacteria bacterium]|nr:VOC family protein [Alphaproteobacteria bacterium]
MPPTPYLFFDGRCEEAAEFYKKAIDAEIGLLMRFKDAPDPKPPGDPNKVMHAALRVAGGEIMMSDGYAKGNPEFKGFSLSLTAKDEADATRMFDALAEGGSVTMPLGPTFFSPCFGMLTDRFGVGWMIIVQPAG